MEEHIEHWHQVKSEKYGQLLKPGWTFHVLAIEIGCRGFVPPRFKSIARRLSFSSTVLKMLHENLQLVARKCSYLIWLNRFNQNFYAYLLVVTSQVMLPLVDPKTSSIVVPHHSRSCLP